MPISPYDRASRFCGLLALSIFADSKAANLQCRISVQAGLQKVVSNRIEVQTQLKVSEVEYLRSVGNLE